MPVLGERSTRGFKPSKIADNELLFEKEMSGTVKTAEERTWFLVLHTIRWPENGVLILRKFATSTIGKTKRKQRRVSRYLAKLLATTRHNKKRNWKEELPYVHQTIIPEQQSFHEFHIKFTRGAIRKSQAYVHRIIKLLAWMSCSAGSPHSEYAQGPSAPYERTRIREDGRTRIRENTGRREYENTCVY